MRTPKAPSLLFFGILAASAGALVALASCTSGDGITPACVYNINDAGVMYPVNGSGGEPACYPFPSCDKGAPELCCLADAGVPLTGNDLAQCLYGYGACTTFVVTMSASGEPNYTCNMSGGSGSSTTSTSGAGGGGGAGGG